MLSNKHRTTHHGPHTKFYDITLRIAASASTTAYYNDTTTQLIRKIIFFTDHYWWPMMELYDFHVYHWLTKWPFDCMGAYVDEQLNEMKYESDMNWSIAKSIKGL